MHVLIIGSGLLGVTTAYFLRRHGLRVTVVDGEPGPGRGASYANGALLHAGLVDPWNAPGIVGQLVRSLGREDAAMLLRLRALPSLLGWGLAFLANSRERRFRANTLRNAELATYTRTVMAELRTQTDIEYGQWFPGTLLVFRDAGSLDSGRGIAEAIGPRGVRARCLTVPEIIGLEPALAAIANELAGGIHYPDDEGGDAFAFCTELTRIGGALGVEFRFGARVERLVRSGNRIRGAVCGGEELCADAFVLAAGSYSPLLLKATGIRLPVRPAKGYSLTIPRGDSAAAPRLPVVDHTLHAAVVPVGSDRIRVVGTAEFAGYDQSVAPARIDNLQCILRRIFPEFAAESRASEVVPWAGLRPLCVDGVPVLGGTSLENLYLNTGHGHLGWTLCAGSAKAVADLIAGRKPEIPLAGFRLDRF